MKDFLIIITLIGFGYLSYKMLSVVFGNDND